MTRVDFYSLEERSPGDRFLLACRLVERIYGAGHRILIHIPDQEQARHLDQLLWTFRQQSFLPHGPAADSDPEFTPILISHDGDPREEHQVLINLSLEVPDFFGSFERLCEPIDQDQNARAAGRKRYAYYRDRGYPCTTMRSSYKATGAPTHGDAPATAPRSPATPIGND